MAAEPPPVLQFQPWQSAVESTFWATLANNKLDKYRLSEELTPLHGLHSCARHAEVSAPLQLTAEAFEAAEEGDSEGASAAPGQLLNVNTLQRFKDLDRAALLDQAGRILWDDIASGAASADPSLLNRFLLVTFADLKRFAFYYWFAFPALVPPQPLRATAPTPLDQVVGVETAAQWVHSSARWRAGITPAAPAWLLHRAADGVQAHPLAAHATLAGWAEGTTVLCVADPCHLAAHPGWPLRNLLLWASVTLRCTTLQVVCMRERQGQLDPHASLHLTVHLPPPPTSPPKVVGWEANTRGKVGPRCADLGPTMDPIQLAHQAVDLNLKLMKWRMLPELDMDRLATSKCLLLGAGTLGCAVARTLLGWGYKHITLVDSGHVAFSNPVRQSLFEFSDCLDGGRPKALAAAERLRAIFPGVHAVGEKLSIPMPGHPVPAAEQPTVLQHVARLTQLVQEADVVFLLTDTRESRWLPTLLCAETNTTCINAALGFDGYLVMRHGVQPSSFNPSLGQLAMPALVEHADEEDTEELASAMGAGDKPSRGKRRDSGELPPNSPSMGRVGLAQLAMPALVEDEGGAGEGTPLGASERAAVGGGEGGEGGAGEEARQVGCYFCNDVVAPQNSTRDRTLDQQCTVTRPGLAFIASALAVELAVAVLHHPQGAAAAAAVEGDDGAAAQSPLGVVPHQIRGFLVSFQQALFAGPAFSQCTACSPCVVNQWRRDWQGFVLKAFNEPSYLEDLTGLTEMQQAADAVCWEEDDDRDDF